MSRERCRFSKPVDEPDRPTTVRELARVGRGWFVPVANVMMREVAGTTSVLGVLRIAGGTMPLGKHDNTIPTAAINRVICPLIKQAINSDGRERVKLDTRFTYIALIIRIHERVSRVDFPSQKLLAVHASSFRVIYISVKGYKHCYRFSWFFFCRNCKHFAPL